MLHHAAGNVDAAAQCLKNNDAWFTQWSAEHTQSHWVAVVETEINRREAHERLGIPLESPGQAADAKLEPAEEASKNE